MSLINKIDKNRLPKHVAIIMDGNGRWAKQRNLDRTMGHVEGVNTVRRHAQNQHIPLLEMCRQKNIHFHTANYIGDQ